MEKILIRGGLNPNGEIHISGAKNSALPIIAASLLTKEEVLLHNIPDLKDMQIMVELIRSLGAKAFFKNNDLLIKSDNLFPENLKGNDLIGDVRSSIQLLGPLISQFKKVTLALPGGCQIGARKLDYHIYGFSKLGARININGNIIEATRDSLQGGHIIFKYPSVGATANIITAACLSEGTTIVENCAKEPEIVDLANFLIAMGAKIIGAGSDIIQITGVTALRGVEYTIIPDRIETGTFIAAAVMNKGDILIRNTNLQLLDSAVSVFVKAGAIIQNTTKGVRVTSESRLHPVNFVTEVFPGVPTDLQPILTSLLSIADGRSIIRETIYENRFMHVPELLRMGAKIEIVKDSLTVDGVKGLKGATVKAPDIRAGAALVLAGLKAKGETIIENPYQIFRGYEDIVGKLKTLGLDCSLIS
jgi:UDP-N-acetylglucosamine 1-carboxyvinyltransferase